ncbi:MAG TPA: hypothetical protein VIW68_02220 [Candidatus Sulfotelmatobacter sp.]
MPIRDHQLAHGLDIAWIISLWKGLHGGDPSPEAIATEVIAALSQYLDRSPGPCGLNTFERHSC